MSMVDELTRRGLLTGVGGAAAAIGLAACGAGPGRADGSRSEDPWTFTDSLGRELALPRRPTRIASLDDGWTATLWSAGLHVVASPLAAGNAAFLSGARVQTATIRRIGTTGSGIGDSINVEVLAAAKPDLIIDDAVDGKALISAANPRIARVAPVAALNHVGPTVAAVIGTGENLVRALGLSVTDDTAKADFATASTRLQKALRAEPGLKVMFCYADGSTGLAVMSPDFYPFIATYQKLGMDYVTPPAAYDEQGNVSVSWENVLSLGADVIVYAGLGLPASNPAWRALPAVRAGQVDNAGVSFYAYYYSNYTTLTTNLARRIEGSRRLG